MQKGTYSKVPHIFSKSALTARFAGLRVATAPPPPRLPPHRNRSRAFPVPRSFLPRIPPPSSTSISWHNPSYLSVTSQDPLY
ncbi:hypothetical protein E2C01_081380 [Portunus trituberculatus]|uniref:Uncharacterized protein n=1 Tax=Portunus trituberculatus TaxID=210409 RepID=A0A5B7IPM3_PORTR|nr:hypothetical protein [Portunus trituberculatus]